MAGSSSHMYSASEVLARLDDQEDFEAELGEQALVVDLHGESSDSNDAQGDSAQEDGSQTFLDAKVLAPDMASILALALTLPLPAERNSTLLLDPELNETGKKYVGNVGND